MKTEIDRQLDRERHDQDREGRKAEAIAVDAGLNPCPTCGEDVSAEEIEHCAQCGRPGCSKCLSVRRYMDGRFCDDDCTCRYYWGVTYGEIKDRFLSILMGDGYWPNENPHEVETEDGLAMQVDFTSSDRPMIRVQLLSRKAG